MKRTLVAMSILTAGIAQASDYTDVARVVYVQPKTVTVMQQQCRTVAVERPATNSNPAGGVLGAIAGAAIGNQLGGGTGKDIATVVGGVIGYQAGRGEDRPGGVEYRQVCENVPVTVQRGRTVTFEYQGQRFTVDLN